MGGDDAVRGGGYFGVRDGLTGGGFLDPFGEFHDVSLHGEEKIGDVHNGRDPTDAKDDGFAVTDADVTDLNGRSGVVDDDVLTFAKLADLCVRHVVTLASPRP